MGAEFESNRNGAYRFNPWGERMVVELYDIARYAPVLAAPFVGSLMALWIVQRPMERAGYGAPSGDAALPPGLVELSCVAIVLWAATVVTGWPLWITCLVGWTLLCLALVDYRQFMLPDVISLPLLVAGLIVAAAGGRPGFADAVIGATVGYGAFSAVGWLYARLSGREGLGLGDAKLLAVAGAWVGWAALPTVVLLASVAALVAALGRSGGVIRLDDARPVAFGPYLGFALWLTLLYGRFL